MATTTNFGWETPDDTDLVKDGAAAIRTTAGAIDASLADLKGGTTGQALVKNSGTDMDFTWSAIDPLQVIDAKGDLIVGAAADTPARLAVGSNNQILVADSTATNGIKWASPSAATKNFTLLNSGGTSLSGATTTISGISGKDSIYVIWKNVAMTTGGGAWTLTFNSDTSANYTFFGGKQQASDYGTNYMLQIESSSDQNGIWLGNFAGSGTQNSSTSSGGFSIEGANSTNIKTVTTQVGIAPDFPNGNYSNAYSTYFSCVYSGTSAISSISFTSSNTFRTGTVYVYGA